MCIVLVLAPLLHLTCFAGCVSTRSAGGKKDFFNSSITTPSQDTRGIDVFSNPDATWSYLTRLPPRGRFETPAADLHHIGIPYFCICAKLLHALL